MKVKMRWGLMALSCMVAAQVTFASEIDGLVNALAEKGIITYGEAQQIISDSTQEARAKIARGEADTLPAWIQNISMKGDLRLRHQVDWKASDAYPRIRERMRFRAGFESGFRARDGPGESLRRGH